MKKSYLLTCSLVYTLLATPLIAVTLPSIFSDHMVLQRGQENPVWGKAEPGESVRVRMDGQEHTTVAGANGRWEVKLQSMPAGGPYVLEVVGADDTIQFVDVLVGEVWLCSGQSNMQWSISNSGEADLEIVSAHAPSIRLITVPNKGSQEPLDDFKGKWVVCSPDTVAGFSAVGYHFGQRLNRALGVPIGLVNNAWGGSAAEAWVPRST